jgi:pyridoxine 4-dehydrogenase
MNNAPFLLGGDLSLNRIGMGTMRLCGQPGNFGPYKDWASAIRLLRQARDLGVNFFDTAHAYGPGWNESLLAPDKVFPDGRPEQLRLRCEESLKRLKVERIDLYQLHRPDPAVPFEESVGALHDLQKEGKIHHVGLSNVSLSQLETATQLGSIASVQNRYNLDEQEDDPVLNYCTRHGIAYLPWGPLAAKPFAKEAPLSSSPRLATLAEAHQATASQIALAWLLHRAPNIVLIPGTTDPEHLIENMNAATLKLTANDLAQLSATARI